MQHNSLLLFAHKKVIVVKLGCIVKHTNASVVEMLLIFYHRYNTNASNFYIIFMKKSGDNDRLSPDLRYYFTVNSCVAASAFPKYTDKVYLPAVAGRLEMLNSL